MYIFSLSLPGGTVNGYFPFQCVLQYSASLFLSLRWWHSWHPPLCSLSVLKILCSFSSYRATFGTCRKRRCSLRWLDFNIANLLWILPNDFSPASSSFPTHHLFWTHEILYPLTLPSQKALLLRDGNNWCKERCFGRFLLKKLWWTQSSFNLEIDSPSLEPLY